MRQLFYLLLFLFLSIQLFGVEQIFWGEGYVDSDEVGSIYKSNSDGSNRVKLFDTNKFSMKLKADTTNKKLYWSDASGISRSNFDGSNRDNVIPITSSIYASFGLDFVNGKIYYFAEDSAKMYIKKANLDGSSPETVIEFTDFSTYTLPGIPEVVVSNTLGKLYFTVVEITNNTGKMYRMNLDGTNLETIITTPNNIRGFDIDETNSKLYWSYFTEPAPAHVDSYIFKADLDGTNSQQLYHLQDTYLVNDITLNSDKSKLFVSSIDGSKVLLSANIDGTSVTTYLIIPRIEFYLTSVLVANVTNADHQPVITSTPVTTATVGQLYSYTLTATDEDGDTLTLTAPLLPAWLTFDASTGVLSGTPAEGNLGEHNVILNVSDGADPIEQVFNITVSANTDHPPVITSIPVTTATVGQELSIYWI